MSFFLTSQDVAEEFEQGFAPKVTTEPGFIACEIILDSLNIIFPNFIPYIAILM